MSIALWIPGFLRPSWGSEQPGQVEGVPAHGKWMFIMVPPSPNHSLILYLLLHSNRGLSGFSTFMLFPSHLTTSPKNVCSVFLKLLKHVQRAVFILKTPLCPSQHLK